MVARVAETMATLVVSVVVMVVTSLRMSSLPASALFTLCIGCFATVFWNIKLGLVSSRDRESPYVPRCVRRQW